MSQSIAIKVTRTLRAIQHHLTKTFAIQSSYQLDNLEPRLLLSGTMPIISEFMGDNADTLLDEDGDSEDWIEIHNPTPDILDLAGWHLTDDPDVLNKWTLPSISVEPDSHLLIFASGKDRDAAASQLHTNFRLNADGEYLALVAPDGITISSEFSPEYPEQFEDISYGVITDDEETALLSPTSDVNALIPIDNTLGLTWTGADEPFNDGSWESGQLGVGYDEDNPQGGAGAAEPDPLVDYPEAILSDSPIAYWRLNESSGSVALDASANMNNLTYTLFGTEDYAHPGLLDDTLDNSVRFTPTAGGDLPSGNASSHPSIVSPNQTDFSFGAGESFSMEYWIKVAPDHISTDNAGIMTKGYDSSQERPWYLSRLTETGAVDFFLRNSSGANSSVTTASSVTDDLWHQVVNVYDASTSQIRIYLDGVLQGVTSNVPADAYGTGSRPFTLGNHFNRGLDAQLDEVSVFDKALTDEQITVHYQSYTGEIIVEDPVDVLNIDFGNSINAGGGSGGIQDGFFAFENTESINTLPISEDYLTTFGNAGDIRFTLSGYTHFRDYPDISGTFVDQSPLLSDMALRNTNGTMTLRFEDLMPGLYEIEMWHHSSTFGGGSIDLYLTDSNNINTNVESVNASSGTIPTGITSSLIEFETDGLSAVEIDLVGGSSEEHVTLNGFSLSQKYSDFTPLIETDVGNEMIGVNSSAYLRIPFDISDSSIYDELKLRMQYDDGFVAYLNGTEVARRNASDTSFDASADSDRDDNIASVFEQIDITSHITSLVDGANILAIHGMNHAIDDEDFLIRPELIGVQVGAESIKYFSNPTPGTHNTGGFDGFVSDTQFSVDRGIFDTAADAFDVQITSQTTDAMIVYTTDGSEPNADAEGFVLNGIEYSEAIHIDGTTTLRAKAFKPGFQPTNVDTHTYLFLDDVVNTTSTPEGYPSTWGGSTVADYWIDDNPSDLAIIAGDPNYSLIEAQSVLKDSLISLPTLSLTMDIQDIFGASGGIYANTEGRGDAWERKVSVELINPDGSSGFQEDGGIRMQGFTSRNPDRNPKHSLRLVFRNEYGAGKLNYEFFGEDGADEFDTIVLRSNSQDAWVYNIASNRDIGQFVRTDWTSSTQAAMGQPAVDSNWVHLYINGIYWGVYNPSERPDSDFAESHFGGDDEDYDVLKNHEEVIDGNYDAYFQLLSLIQNDPNNFNAGYRDLSSPADYAAVQEYVDVENLIDYMIHNMYAAVTDWPGNNYILRNRVTGEGFKFFDWDSEHAFKVNVNTNRTLPHSRDDDSPTKFHHALTSNAEYRALFADHLHKAFSEGGALYVDPDNPEWDPAHPERNVPAARWMEITSRIEPALVAESARWGDYRRDVIPTTNELYTPHDQFLIEQQNLLNNWFPYRSAIVLEQFRQAGLYSDIAAPEFNQNGGEVPPGFELTMSTDETTLFNETVIVNAGDSAKAFVASDDSLGLSWTNLAFDDTAWEVGVSGVGYEDTAADYDTLIGLDIQAAWDANETSAYIRMPFSLPTDFNAEDYDNLILRMRYDDGFVAYINGVEVEADNAPLERTYDIFATDQPSDTTAQTFIDFDITNHINLLQPEDNILAIHGLNRSNDSSDMLIMPELVLGENITPTSLPIYYTTDGADPRVEGGDISLSAIPYTGPITISDAVHIHARTFINGQWSPLKEEIFLLNQRVPLRITEIHYHPTGPSSSEINEGFVDDDMFEFIEVRNISDTVAVNLESVQFNNGIDFKFSEGNITSLQPGEYALVVRNQAAFEYRYGALTPNDLPFPVAGEFDGGINNGGDAIRLVSNFGAIIHDFRYEDGNDPVSESNWHPHTDGDGPSLTALDTEGEYSEGGNWTMSGMRHGTPGRPDPVEIALGGDFNYDGVVNLADLAKLASNFGKNRNSNPELDVRWEHGDSNADGIVNLTDLAKLASNFGLFGSNGFPGPVGVAAANTEDESITAKEAILTEVVDDHQSRSDLTWSHIGNILDEDNSVEIL